MKPDASFAFRCSVAKMRAAGRVDENALEGVRRLLETWRSMRQTLNTLQLCALNPYTIYALMHRGSHCGIIVDGGTWSVLGWDERVAQSFNRRTWLASCRRRILRQLMMGNREEWSGEAKVMKAMFSEDHFDDGDLMNRR
jgi:hypothetical protein